MREYWMALLALCPATALAQPVFFDDFEGNALLPHWIVPPPTVWEHNVSNGMLNVTGLFSPSSPKIPGNFAGMGTVFSPQTDFQMDVWMGWEAGQAPHQLIVSVRGPGGNPILARFGYAHDEAFGPTPVIFAHGSQPPVTQPAPLPGIHQFTIARVGAQFEFSLDGTHFASSPDNFGTPAGGVGFNFVGPYPGALGAFHIDRVLVVPAPSALVVAPALALACAWPRKRRNVFVT